MIAYRNRSIAVSLSVLGVLLAAVLVAFFVFSSGVSANHGWADCSQYLYVANEGNGGGTIISRIDCHGHVGIYDSSLSGVSGLATDGTYLFASDDNSPGVYRFDAAGTKLDSFVERPVRDGPWSARVSGREAPRAVGC